MHPQGKLWGCFRCSGHVKGGVGTWDVAPYVAPYVGRGPSTPHPADHSCPFRVPVERAPRRNAGGELGVERLRPWAAGHRRAVRSHGEHCVGRPWAGGASPPLCMPPARRVGRWRGVSGPARGIRTPNAPRRVHPAPHRHPVPRPTPPHPRTRPRACPRTRPHRHPRPTGHTPDSSPPHPRKSKKPLLPAWPRLRRLSHIGNLPIWPQSFPPLPPATLPPHPTPWATAGPLVYLVYYFFFFFSRKQKTGRGRGLGPRRAGATWPSPNVAHPNHP